MSHSHQWSSVPPEFSVVPIAVQKTLHFLHVRYPVYLCVYIQCVCMHVVVMRSYAVVQYSVLVTRLTVQTVSLPRESLLVTRLTVQTVLLPRESLLCKTTVQVVSYGRDHPT